MNTINKYFRLSIRYMILSYINLVQFPFEFVMKVVDLIFSIGFTYVFWISVYNIGADFKGWTVYGIVLLVAMNIFSDAISKIFFGFRDLEFSIINGEFDKYLIRPVHPLFSVLMDKLNIFVIFSKMAIAICMIAYCSIKGNVVLHLHDTVVAVLCLIVGTIAFNLLYGAFTLLTFWFGKIYMARELVFSFHSAKQYPLDVFPRTFMRIFTYFIPLMFLSTIPTKILIGHYEHPNFYLKVACLSITVNTILIAFVWKKALTRYNSTGS